jgi:hypothetical protein
VKTGILLEEKLNKEPRLKKGDSPLLLLNPENKAAQGQQDGQGEAPAAAGKTAVAVAKRTPAKPAAAHGRAERRRTPVPAVRAARTSSTTRTSMSTGSTEHHDFHFIFSFEGVIMVFVFGVIAFII